MRLLKDILYKVSLKEVVGPTDIKIKSVCFDSRKVKKGSLFVAVKGTQVDGHKFIPDVETKGAVAIICETFPKKQNDKITYVKVNDSALALSIVAGNFYGNPSEQLKLVGITGTNGKTTIATLLHRLFTNAGYKVGLLSTVENLVGEKVIKATHTTPDAIAINALMEEVVAAGCDYCFMEVSSHAIHQKRVAGLTFTGAAFTNISHDHLDYHKTFKEYISAKKALFDGLSSDAFALTNIDDRRGKVMVQNTKAKVFTYSIKKNADYRLKVLENAFGGLILNIDGQEVYARLIGEFNAYNLLTIYAIADLLGMDKMEVLQLLSKLESAEGRFDYFITPKKKIVGIVDYAHTPDALKKVLASIKQIRTGNEKVITVVGCGGDRDRDKRPLMAKIACQLSNQIVLTSDNPRSEDPQQIIEEMQQGVTPNFRRKVLSVLDRKEAIKTACTLADSGDIILLAGKGHEKYQEIKGKRLPFDDKKVLQDTLKDFDE